MNSPSAVRASVQPLCVCCILSSFFTTTTNGRRGRGQALDELGDAPPEEAPLGFGVGEPERALERCASLVGAAEPAQEVGAGGVEVLVAVQVEPVDEREPGSRSLGLG